MRAVYTFALLLAGLLSLPYWLYQLTFRGKYRKSLKNRLGFLDLPEPKAPSIWLHMVSVGETRAVIPLYEALKKKFPDTPFFLSTITETGLAEARRSLKGATGYFILPFDFPYLMDRLVRRLKVKLLILSEGDLWFSMLSAAKKQGATIALVSGKLSEKSARRFAKVPFFARRLFGFFDCICAQNKTYAERFIRFSPRVTVTGNLKLDAAPPQLSAEKSEELQQRLKISPSDSILVLGSTHPGEEELLLSLLDKLPFTKILLVPRHPERFERVFASLPPHSGRLSSALSGDEKIILIDAMGLLNSCYGLAKVAIVGGSFVPGIGGHNILEPVQAHIPVFFGPYMHNQPELVDLVLQAGAGLQLEATELPRAIGRIMQDPAELAALQEKAAALALSCRGSLERTLQALDLILDSGLL